MDLIDQKLTTYSHNKKYRASIRAAVSLAKKTLNRYYELTDSSEVYRIAMGKQCSTPSSTAVMLSFLTFQ
jgi:NOL1/NOP2/fmu family ribosome biogenesis protein